MGFSANNRHTIKPIHFLLSAKAAPLLHYLCMLHLLFQLSQCHFPWDPKATHVVSVHFHNPHKQPNPTRTRWHVKRLKAPPDSQFLPDTTQSRWNSQRSSFSASSLISTPWAAAQSQIANDQSASPVSESMCEQSGSGRNREWLLIKLSIPVHVIPSTNIPPPKKTHRYLTRQEAASSPADQKSHPHKQITVLQSVQYVVFFITRCVSGVWYFK